MDVYVEFNGLKICASGTLEYTTAAYENGLPLWPEGPEFIVDDYNIMVFDTVMPFTPKNNADAEALYALVLEEAVIQGERIQGRINEAKIKDCDCDYCRGYADLY